jgi:hypothetical protein
MIVGSLAAVAMGASLPIFAFLRGDMTDSFSQRGDDMVEKSRSIMFIFFIVAAGVLVAGWIMFAGWMIAG